VLFRSGEADLYRAFCAADCVYAIPNGVDLDHFRPMPSAAADESQQCVFVGALDYRANVDGITWYCTHVWPEVRRRRPQSGLLIIGSNPAPAVRRLADLPGVRLTGPVADVRPYLAEAAVAVAPLRIARGLQNKVLEALAMGKAVIATPQAREGLDVQSGHHLLEATTPLQWIQATLALLDAPHLRAALGRAGRGYVEQHHHWDVRLAPFAALLSIADTNVQASCPSPTVRRAAAGTGYDR
jgi:sugar transferase (PEP-CTERM/EpsH1 system associated)